MRALAGIDILSSSTPAVVDEAARFAQALGATLDLAFVDGLPYVEALIHDPAIRGVFEAEAERVRRDRQARLTELVEGLPVAVRGVPSFHFGNRPADTLAELARGYDVLMVATHGRTGIGHLLLGSVAERVVRLASVPTLVLRTPG